MCVCLVRQRGHPHEYIHCGEDLLQLQINDTIQCMVLATMVTTRSNTMEEEGAEPRRPWRRRWQERVHHLRPSHDTVSSARICCFDVVPMKSDCPRAYSLRERISRTSTVAVRTASQAIDDAVHPHSLSRASMCSYRRHHCQPSHRLPRHSSCQ